jgi:cytochrome c biogenesis protein CcmG, thiol:disulfide interchange protein DsbE
MKKLLLIISVFLAVTSLPLYANSNTAPDFKLPGMDGPVQLSDFKGKVVYLDFWASWCQPCKKSFPWMNEIQHKYADEGLKIVAVNLDKNRELADKFLKKMQADFNIVFDEKGATASTYKLRGMPSSFIITRDGLVYASHIGFRDKDKEQLEDAIKSLLDK